MTATPFYATEVPFCALSVNGVSVSHSSIQEIQLSADGTVAALYTVGDKNANSDNVLFVCRKENDVWRQLDAFPYEFRLQPRALALSGNGRLIAMTTYHPDAGLQVDVYENMFDLPAHSSGWQHCVTLDPPTPDVKFGHQLALDYSGTTLAIAAPLDWNQEKFIHRVFDRAGNFLRTEQLPALKDQCGCVFIYTHNSERLWTLKEQIAGPTLSESSSNGRLSTIANFATRVSLDSAGRRLLISQKQVDLSATCVVYHRTLTQWVKSSTAPLGACGVLSCDGLYALVAQRAPALPEDTTGSLRSIIYVLYRYTDAQWEYDSTVTDTTYRFEQRLGVFQFGFLSGDGLTVAIAETKNGHPYVFFYERPDVDSAWGLAAIKKSKAVWYRIGKKNSRARGVLIAMDRHARTILLSSGKQKTYSNRLKELQRAA